METLDANLSGSIDEIAQHLVAMIPHLRNISAESEDVWLHLHLRITELGGFTPVEALILQQVVDGLLPGALQGEDEKGSE